MQETKKSMSVKKWVLLGVCSALLFNITKSCTKAIDEKWAERASVYDIRSEVHWGMLTTPPYGFALWLGIPDDSWLLKPLVAINNRAYERGIAKIPENDGERARLWYKYKYWAYTWSNPQKYAAKIIPEAMKEFEFLSKAESKSKFFREVEQYYIILRMVGDFFIYRGFVDFIPTEEKNKTFINITDWLMENCDNLNMNLFLKNKNISGEFQAPLECQRWSIEYMEHAYKNGMMCEKISLKAIDKNYKKMQEMAEKYYIPAYQGKSQPGIIQDVEYMLKNRDRAEYVIKSTPERCEE